jgi:phage terminase Nu1 subunit (DNA packaging protein)
MAEQELPAKAIAKLLDISLARVGQLAKEGIFHRLPNGKYHLDTITKYVQYVRDRKGVLDQDSQKRLDEERIRKLKRENDLAEGLIAPLSELEDALAQVGQQIVVNLEALPLEMKRANPRLTGHDIQAVKKSIARCCNAISEIQIDRVEN